MTHAREDERQRVRWVATPVLALTTLAATAACYDGPSREPGADGGDASATDGTETDGDPTDSDTDGTPLVFDPAPAVLPRLTADQYRNSLQSVLAPGLPAVALEPDTNPYLFFNIGATTTTLSELGTQLYEEAADELTHAIFGDPNARLALVGCEPLAPGDQCVQGFLEDFGRRAYRRPLTSEELLRWQQITVQLANPDAWEGLRLAVAGMLQSPHFLYRVELGEPDPEDPARLRFTSHEMASRLSFLLWNTTPDDELLDAAATDVLLTEQGLREHAERMLADPRASAAIQEFFAQFFDLGRLDGIARDPMVYPMFSSTLPASMKTEVQLLVNDFVFRRDADIRGIFGTRNTFVNEELAMLYGVDAPGASPISFVPVELPADGPRAGMLTLGAFLMMNAHETEPSPTRRGKYLRERVLCQTVQPPPDDVDTNIPEQEGEGKTLRERLSEHATNPACAGCHSFIDPPGFLFESFDSIGVFRTVDKDGLTIDASGELDGQPLASATELGPMLAADPRVGTCVVKQLFRHAQGRLEHETEADILLDLGDRFADDGYRFKRLLLTLITHEGFRTLAPAEEEGA
ncbi:DUF1592 domain-containing protein [Paraliomyxa miuraensis]|uniref:DUF1592 domain-containing protein n=1 Tax=Paraliomyxa miuraensis TaxID=376150 RepID=UPI002258EB99|nr:DUF1592 domain-containing protein [Paraliomyxa miuraensis]MCX4240923.1 DUF1592 domain-containing protein [Paraliomyxa miuraensis]